MGRSRRSGHSVLAALYLAATASAFSIPTLFERATCPDPNYTACSGSGLPGNFCCPQGSSCLTLAGNTTVLCCPTNSDCSNIKPITCDIQFQNVTAHPDNTLKTTALSAKLPTCGTACCPFGYTCNSAGICAMNADQTSAPGALAGSISNPIPSASQTGATSIVPTSNPTSTSTPAQNSSPAAAPITSSQSCNKFPTPAILVGFFPGLLLGVLLTVASMCILGAHRRNTDRRRSGSSFGNISEPRAMSDTGMRTDFLRKPPQTPSTMEGSGTPGRMGTVQRVRSIFRKSTAGPQTQYTGQGQGQGSPVPPMPLNIRKPNAKTVVEQRPVTPVAQREPSFEDIDIYADGGTASALREREHGMKNGGKVGTGGALAPKLQPPWVDGRASHQTTFGDMMNGAGSGQGYKRSVSRDSNLAGLPVGQPYVYKGSSGFSPPRPRGS